MPAIKLTCCSEEMKEVLGPCITRPGPCDFGWFGIKSQMEGPVEMVWGTC